MIQEAYVSFEVAKLLKEKGFEEETYGNYYLGGKFDGEFEESSKVNWNKFFKTPIAAPTQQLACEWLRQNYNLSVEVYRTAYGWIGCIVAIPSGTDIKFIEDEGDDPASGAYTTHHKACEATIKYCLENLINYGK